MVKGKYRKPGTGCIIQINDHLWEGRYSSKVNGKCMARNVCAPTEEECEQKLAELIQEMKKKLGSFGSRKKRAENRKPPSGKALPERGDFSCLWLLYGQKQFDKIA